MDPVTIARMKAKEEQDARIALAQSALRSSKSVVASKAKRSPSPAASVSTDRGSRSRKEMQPAATSGRIIIGGVLSAHKSSGKKISQKPRVERYDDMEAGSAVSSVAGSGAPRGRSGQPNVHQKPTKQVIQLYGSDDEDDDMDADKPIEVPSAARPALGIATVMRSRAGSTSGKKATTPEDRDVHYRDDEVTMSTRKGTAARRPTFRGVQRPETPEVETVEDAEQPSAVPWGAWSRSPTPAPTPPVMAPVRAPVHSSLPKGYGAGEGAYTPEAFGAKSAWTSTGQGQGEDAPESVRAVRRRKGSVGPTQRPASQETAPGPWRETRLPAVDATGAQADQAVDEEEDEEDGQSAATGFRAFKKVVSLRNIRLCARNARRMLTIKHSFMHVAIGVLLLVIAGTAFATYLETSAPERMQKQFQGAMLKRLRHALGDDECRSFEGAEARPQEQWGWVTEAELREEVCGVSPDDVSSPETDMRAERCGRAIAFVGARLNEVETEFGPARMRCKTTNTAIRPWACQARLTAAWAAQGVWELLVGFLASALHFALANPGLTVLLTVVAALVHWVVKRRRETQWIQKTTEAMFNASVEYLLHGPVEGEPEPMVRAEAIAYVCGKDSAELKGKAAGLWPEVVRRLLADGRIVKQLRSIHGNNVDVLQPIRTRAAIFEAHAAHAMPAPMPSDAMQAQWLGTGEAYRLPAGQLPLFRTGAFVQPQTAPAGSHISRAGLPAVRQGPGPGGPQVSLQSPVTHKFLGSPLLGRLLAKVTGQRE